MNKSSWDDDEMMPFALEILAITPKGRNFEFGFPCLTPYQISLEFKQMYPKYFEELGLKLGGKGTSEHNSLTREFSSMLTRESRKAPNNLVEKIFFYRLHNHDLIFSKGKDHCVPSDSQYPYLSMFRLTKKR